MKRPWTFSKVVRAARAAGERWEITGYQGVRCMDGFCPLGAVFTRKSHSWLSKARNPDPSAIPVRTVKERLAFIRIAYAADSPSSPDRDALLRGLGIL